jgi:hypothetical protein
MLTTRTIVHTVHDLVRPLEPVASVYLGEPGGDAIDVAEEFDLRWRALAGELAASGADRYTIEAIAEDLAELAERPRARAVFADGGRVLLARDLPGESTVDRAGFGAPPMVAPLLAWRLSHPAYVEVVTDRTGAQVTSVAAGGAAPTVEQIIGTDDEIERNAPGGWSQPRYQRRAEDSWRHNAAAVAGAVGAALRRVDADLLLVAGDVRAVQLLRERLPHGSAARVRVAQLPGGLSPDGSAHARHASAERAIRAYADTRAARVLARFDAAPLGVAVRGVSETLAALAVGRVQTLIVMDEPDDRRQAWFSPELLCAGNPDRRAPGGLRPGRMIDVAVRAALLTDAEVLVCDASLALEAGVAIPEGVAGLCRYE